MEYKIEPREFLLGLRDRVQVYTALGKDVADKLSNMAKLDYSHDSF